MSIEGGGKELSLYCLAGWAQPENALEELCRSLGSVSDWHAASTAQLYQQNAADAGSDDVVEPSVYARGLLREVQKLPRPRAVLGWSMGGLVVLEAMRLGLAEEVDKLVLVSSTARFVKDPSFPQGVPKANLSALRAAMATQPQAALWTFFNLVFSREKKARTAIKARIAEALQYDTACLLHGLDYLAQADYRPVLPKVALPVLVLHGSADKVIPLSSAEHLAECLSNCRMTVVADGDHGFVRDRVEIVVNIIDEFLQQ